MKMSKGRQWLVVVAVLMLVGIVGCDENNSDVGGIIAIISAVGDLVIGITRAAT